MDIQPTAKQSMPNFSSITSKSGSGNAASQYGSSISVTSNDSTTLRRQLSQIKSEIQQLNGQSGSSAQLQKLETQMSDIQKRLQDLASKQATGDVSQTKKNSGIAKTQQALSDDFSKNVSEAKETDKKAPLYSFIGMFLDVYA